MNLVLFINAVIYFIFGLVSACGDDVLLAIFWMLATIALLLFKREFE